MDATRNYIYPNTAGRTVTGTISKEFVLEQLTAFARNESHLTNEQTLDGITTFTSLATKVGLTDEQVQAAIAEGQGNVLRKRHWLQRLH